MSSRLEPVGGAITGNMRRRTMVMAAPQLGMLHVLPSGIKCIRHYGVLASGCKAVKLRQAREALHMPVPNALALGAALAFMARVAGIDIGLCPQCRVGRLVVIDTIAGLRQLPAPGAAVAVAPRERGPP